ncbi:glycosyltransferase family 2 protein [Brevibacillus brevis]|uniref:Glycosyltransferase family 2 protein n=1 Tax=Brevibacillus brevis TaxID=1393 RepID=A0ABY9T015_BREBE|nr:glycosyltransferase family 2 protein [Brevibacillus brevis]WNC13433.1 glycosyltransferase family 2 protein [Brevibacillus brevis]
MKGNREAGLVSVVVTNYNRADYLLECLDSILAQTYRKWELIFIDDASTDDSVAIVNEWLRRHQASLTEGQNQVILHVLPRNIGFAGAINVGFYLARGEYIAVQDSDDYSHVRRLERQVAFLQENPQIELVGTNYYAFPSETPTKRELSTWIKYGSDIRKVYGNGGHCVCHGTILFRARLFDQIGGPTRRIEGAEDYEFIAKSLNARANIENLPEALYYYRQHENQRSTKYYRRKEEKK